MNINDFILAGKLTGSGGGGGGAGEEVTVNIVNNRVETVAPSIYYSVEINNTVNALRIFEENYYYDETGGIAEISGGTTQERKYLKLSEYFYIEMYSDATVSGSAEIVWLPDFEVHAAKISGDCVITIPSEG